MLEVEVLGLVLAPAAPPAAEIERLCAVALASAGIEDGHMTVHFVDGERITELNREQRGRDQPTDVLSFPLDGVDADGRAPLSKDAGPPRELGDIVICPPQTVDIVEAIVHGALHLTGMDHDVDDGEMLTLQRELLAWERHE